MFLKEIVLRYLCILLVFSVSSAIHAQSRGQNTATRVIAQAVVFEPLNNAIEAVGTAEALQSVDIFPAVADKVIAVNFVPGQVLEKNSVLVALDARRQQASVKRAEIALADAQRNLRRLEQSKSNGAVTQSAIDDAKTIRDLAQITLTDAKIELADRYVRAPFSGVVGLTDIEVGDRITQNTLITTIDNRQQLFVNFNAPESSLASIANDKSVVSLQPWSNRELDLPASIAQFDSRINEQDRTVRVRALLNNDNDEFLPGMSFRVKMVLNGAYFAAIPESGLSWGVDGAYVWLIKDDKAQKVSVQIKQRLRGRLLVEGAINENDMLIVEGIQRLRPSQAVEIVELRGSK